MQNYLIHYVRDEKKYPFGCIVATLVNENGVDVINVDYSLQHPGDVFDKKLGIKIALGRAERGLDRRRGMRNVNPEVKEDFLFMCDRAGRYFKGKPFSQYVKNNLNLD